MCCIIIVIIMHVYACILSESQQTAGLLAAGHCGCGASVKGWMYFFFFCRGRGRGSGGGTRPLVGASAFQSCGLSSFDAGAGLTISQQLFGPWLAWLSLSFRVSPINLAWHPSKVTCLMLSTPLGHIERQQARYQTELLQPCYPNCNHHLCDQLG